MQRRGAPAEHPGTRSARWWAGVALAGVALAGPATFAAAPAPAAPPFDLPAELVDEQGALSDPAAVEQAQEAYVRETGRQLFVVVVDDLDGWAAGPWLEETARLSGLGEEDLALLVVTGSPPDNAGGGLDAALRVPDGAGVPAGAVTRTERDVLAAAAGGDPDQVVRAALAGLRAAGVDRPGEATARALWWAAAAVLVLAVAGAGALWLVRRTRTATQEAADRVRAEELSGTLGTLVVDLDVALDEARLELDLARARVREDSSTLLARAEEQLRQARREAVQVHRRRAELSLGPTTDLTWRVPPGEAVAELEELHTLARSARERLRGLRLPA